MLQEVAPEPSVSSNSEEEASEEAPPEVVKYEDKSTQNNPSNFTAKVSKRVSKITSCYDYIEIPTHDPF